MRLSGPDALHIADALFRSSDGPSPMDAKGFARLDGRVLIDQAPGLPAECYVFRAPRSYTRQNTAELHVIGSVPLLAMLVEQAVKHGARTAGPGEFTARAFLAGAMDLTQAEAVASVIAARSDSELRAAQRSKEGELADQARALADGLTELLSLVEADIDFSEEPIDFVSPAGVRDRLARLGGRLDDLLERSASTERLSVLPVVTLTGAANAGKSTLLNALTGLDRAICSATAGTTRDVLSAPLKLPGGEVLLQDTAGHAHNADEISHLWGEQTRMAAGRADVVCLVVDVTADATLGLLTAFRALRGHARLLVAANKIDLLEGPDTRNRICELEETCSPARVYGISALSGAGLAELRHAIAERTAGSPGAAHDAPVALNARQRKAFAECRTAMHRAGELTDQVAQTIDCAELVALEIREALDALGCVTGRVTPEDVLGRIFGSFCIGK